MKKKDLIYLFILVGLVLLLINSCKKDEKEPTLPILTTSAVSSISQNTAISGGIITNDGGAKIKTRGVCWGLNSNPTISDSITIDGVGSGSFTSNIIGLTSGTIYFVRAYATNSAGTSYGNEFSFSTTINDIDGNVYHIVTIGTQVWMVENLKTTKYRNGNLIPNVIDNTQWCNLTSGAYCNLNNDINITNTYGRLYNWYSVNDIRNIAPSGWHIPSNNEWTTLEDYLGGSTIAGGKLKETGYTHWLSPNTGATNESGFSALPSSDRNGFNGSFGTEGYNCYLWTKTEYDVSNAGRRVLDNGWSDIGVSYAPKRYGYSVRCIKD